MEWGSPEFFAAIMRLLDGWPPEGPSTLHIDWPGGFVLLNGVPVGRHTRAARAAEDAAAGQSAARRSGGRRGGSERDEEQWDKWLEQLIQYRAAHGDALVPYVKGKGAACAVPACGGVNHKQLGKWVSKQRSDKKDNDRWMTPERIAKLKAVDGWVWDTYEHAWGVKLAELKDFQRIHNHARVPARGCSKKCKHAGCKGAKHKALGMWVAHQRRFKRQRSGRLTSARIAALEKVKGWLWDIEKTAA